MSIIGEVVGLVAPESWVDGALCPQIGDGDLWFPEKGNQAHDARRVCLKCPVRVECLDFAVRTEQRHGMYGGFSERDRERLNRGTNPLRGVGAQSRKAAPGKRLNGHGIACRCPICEQAA